MKLKTAKHIFRKTIVNYVNTCLHNKNSSKIAFDKSSLKVGHINKCTFKNNSITKSNELVSESY